MTLKAHATSAWTMAALAVLILLSPASAAGRHRIRTRADGDLSQPLVIDLDAVSVDPDATIPVSVVIPTFDRAGQITAAVASALAQVPAPLEVIVIDDASNDDTARVAEAAGATVVRNPTNLGQGPARNVGIRAAGAEWVAFLDSDDVWHAGHLGRLWRHRRDHVLVAAAGQGTENGRIYGHPGPGPLELNGPGDALARCNPVLCSGSMVRREVALEVGGFSDRRRPRTSSSWLVSSSGALVWPCPTSASRTSSTPARSAVTCSRRDASTWRPYDRFGTDPGSGRPSLRPLKQRWGGTPSVSRSVSGPGPMRSGCSRPSGDRLSAPRPRSRCSGSGGTSGDASPDTSAPMPLPPVGCPCADAVVVSLALAATYGGAS